MWRQQDVLYLERFVIDGVAVDDVTLARDVTVTYLERLVVAGVAVDDGERVDEAEAAEIADVVDQLRHGDDHLTTAQHSSACW